MRMRRERLAGRPGWSHRRNSGQTGAVAVVVAVSLLVLLVAGGVIDVSRAILLREELQQAVDATALAAAKEGIPNTYTTDAEVQAYLRPIARSYFDTKFRAGSSSVTVSPITLSFNAAANTVSVSVSASMTSAMLQVIELPAIPLDISALTERARPGPIEMVLSLDDTWSMMDMINGERKIVSLKRAATSLVNSLMVTDNVPVCCGDVTCSPRHSPLTAAWPRPPGRNSVSRRYLS